VHHVGIFSIVYRTLFAAAVSTKWQCWQMFCVLYSSRGVFCLHTYK